MNQDKFFKFVDWRVKQIINTLIEKGEEYSKEDNKLHNFDVGAQMTGKLREEVLLGFVLKHQISLLDIIEDLKEGKIPKNYLVAEKLGDIINYYILLEASLQDRIQKEMNDRRERENKEILTN